MSFLDPRMAQRLAIYTNELVPFHGITAFVAEVRQFSLPITMMQITNNNQWLWRVTQAVCFFVQRSVFSWALPAGVRIPSNASSFCWFVTQVLSCCRLSAFFVCLLFCFGKACWEWYSVLKRASDRGDFVSAHREGVTQIMANSASPVLD